MINLSHPLAFSASWRFVRWLLIAGLASATVVHANVARADDSAAEALFDEGVRAMKAREFDKACPLLAQAVKLSGGQAVGGLLLLGECHEGAGRSASAWAAYRQAAAFAKQAGQLDRAETAKAAIDRLEPTLHRLKIVVSTELRALPGLVIERNGEVVPEEAWGIAVPIDPVTVVQATLPGREPFRVNVAPKSAGTSEVVLAPWGEAPAAPPKDDEGGTVVGTAPAAPKLVQTESSFGGLGITGVVTGLVGAGGLAAALGLGLTAKSDYDDAIALPAHACSGGLCNAAGKAAVSDARSLGDAATACMIVGSVLLATGVTLVIVDLADSPASGEGVSALVGPDRFALAWRFQ